MKKTVLFLSLLCSQWVGAQQRGAYVVWDNGASIAPPPQEKRYALVIGNNAYQYISSVPTNKVWGKEKLSRES